MKQLLLLTINQCEQQQGALLRVGLGQVVCVSGRLLGWAVSQRQGVSGALLRVGFAQMNAPKRRHFAGSEAIGIGDYDVMMTVSGLTFDVCQLTDSMTITHGENEAYTCEFVLQQPINPRSQNGVEVDLYQWYGRKIVVNAVHDGGVMRLYQGMINRVQPDFATGRIQIGCTDMRRRLMDALPKETVRAIGYTSQAAHGELDNLSDELTRRLETVPASFEFDVYGRGYLNPWLPSAPKRVIDGCLVYMRQPSARLAQVGEVVNRVDVSLSVAFSRLLHRSLVVGYDVGLNVCQYADYQTVPTVKDIADAVSQTGWALGWFRFTRVAASGWYDCGGRHKMGFLRDYRTATLKEDGSYDQVTVTPNLGVISGQFELSRRWVQSVGYVYDLTYRNAASIARYGELMERMSFQVASVADKLADGWADNVSPHKDGVRYQLVAPNDVMAASGITMGQVPARESHRFAVASNGDVYADVGLDEKELHQTLLVAYHTARTKMWASHRQNTVDVQLKFLPELSLKDAHQLEFKHVSGLMKVAHFVHRLDVLAGVGATDVQYRFFQNAADGLPDDAVAMLPESPISLFPKRKNGQFVSRVELRRDETLGNQVGVIYRQVVGRLYQPLGVRIGTPEIESASTDAAQWHRVAEQSIHIPNNQVVFRM